MMTRKLPATSPRSIFDHRIAHIGDSITLVDGYNVPATLQWPAVSAANLRALGAYVCEQNLAVSGQTSYQMAARVNQLWTTPFGLPDMVAIMAGVNDPGASIAQTPGRPPAGLAAAVGGAGNVNVGHHDYLVTYYNISTPAQETWPGAKVSLNVTPANGASSVTVTVPTTGCPSGWGRKVYRTLCTLSGSATAPMPYPTYNAYLVATVADNTTTSATDNVTDATAVGNAALSIGQGTTQSNIEYMLDQAAQAGITKAVLTTTHWSNYAAGDALGTPRSDYVPVRTAQWNAYATFGSGAAQANPFGSGTMQVLMVDIYNSLGAIINASATYKQTGDAAPSVASNPYASPYNKITLNGTTYTIKPLDGIWHTIPTNQHPGALLHAAMGQIMTKAIQAQAGWLTALQA